MRPLPCLPLSMRLHPRRSARAGSIACAVRRPRQRRRRLRPILMTAIATIFALLPMALGLTGSGGFISQPLAVVVIGGLISSTLLTLVLVPTLYTMIESAKERRRARRAGIPAQPADPDPLPELNEVPA